MELPHILFLGSEIGRREAIGKLERYAYRLQGQLLGVGCDHSAAQFRPPIKPADAERDLGLSRCNHAIDEGPRVNGYFCPECGEQTFSLGIIDC